MKKIYLLIFSITLFIYTVSCSEKKDIISTSNSSIPSTNKVTTTTSSMVEQEGVNLVMQKYIDSLIDNTTSYIPYWNKENFKGKWNYIDGVFLNSIVNLYYSLKDTNISKANEYKDFLINYVNYYIDKDGNFLNIRNPQQPGFVTTELDTICESKILFDLYEITKDQRYINAIDYTYNSVINMPKVEGSPNYWHKTSYVNQIWLDGMYMYAPFYARYASAYNKPEILKDIKSQYAFIRNNMFDEEKGLYHHGYDSTKSIFWADKTSGCSKEFWLRSIGWYIVSLSDVLEYYPEGEDKAYLNDLLKEALDGILKYQDSNTKMFYQVVDKGDITVEVPANYLEKLKNTKYQVNGTYQNTKISNYLETSGSSMIAYSLIKSANKGYIDASYKQRGIEIFEGIYNTSFKNNSLGNICITAGLGPDNKPFRDGTLEYYLAEPVGNDDAKGVGPFIMAYLEYAYNIPSIPTPNLK